MTALPTSQPAAPARRPLLRADGTEARVSALELFFDLVFVFALTQVTAAMAQDPTFTGLAHGMLVLVPVYWAWAGYAWLTSTVDPEWAPARLVVFGAMGAMLAVALATPGAFGEDTLIWGLGYVVVRLLHVALFALAARGNPALARQVMSLVIALAPVTALILVAGLAFEGATRDGLWLGAIVLDFAIVLAAGAEGWVVRAGHFAERFGLVVIIALGESIVAIGVGAAELELGGSQILAAMIALVVICALWWAYFDVAAQQAEQRFREAVGGDQLRIARDAYALGHLPMIAGIALFALGVKKVLEHTADPLEAMPAVALGGGLALYAAAQVGFRARSGGALSRPRVLTGLACAALVPVALTAPAVLTLALLAAVWVALIGYETMHA